MVDDDKEINNTDELAEPEDESTEETDKAVDDKVDEPTETVNDSGIETEVSESRTTPYGLIRTRQLDREMEESYIDYAMSVIVSRALPDVRDGLKPVHRRILYTMWDTGLKSTVKYRKCAAVIGEVLKSYHPHGDIAVYDTLVRMAQSFSMRYQLVDGQGNFGSIDGDSAAAYRYTEARMAGIAEELLFDIEKETADFIPNYDGTTTEPTVLPAKLPNLLLNGALGIAVGMATNIPPHNLTEICNGILELIDNPEATIDDLIKHVTGPDFPTGGLIFNIEDIRTAYTTGKGRIVMRGIAEIIEQTRGYQIVISAIPYQVNKAELITKIADLVKDKKIEGISDLRDESDREENVRIVIDLKQNAFPKKILNQLYALTVLESAFHVNLLALVDGIQPRVLTLKQVLEEYLKHRTVVVRRRTEFDLTRAKERAHILEGLKTALDQIDAVIDTIRKSASRDEARDNLVRKFKLTEIQANAILEMRLAALAALERQKVEDELKEKLALIATLEAILASEEKIKAIIRDEVVEIRDKYGDGRRTQVIPHAISGFRAEDLIPNEQVIVTLTRGGYVKRVPVATYRSQHRGGKGVVGMETKEEDAVEHLVSTWTHNDISFFTDRGRIFVAKVYDLPSASRQAKGQAVQNIIQIAPDEKVTSLIMLDKSTRAKAHYFFMGTEHGIVKKTAIDAYANVRKNGIVALKLRPNDTLRWVATTSGNDRIMMVSRAGQAILFNETDVRSMGRTASGVTGMRLRSGDRVMAMTIITEERLQSSEQGAADEAAAGKRGRKPDGPMLLTVLENGFGKRTSIEEFRGQRRGGLGVRAARTNAKTGTMIGAIVTTSDSGDLIIMSNHGVIIRMPLKSAKKLGRDTQGVTLMRLNNKADRVSSASIISKEEGEPEVAAEGIKEENVADLSDADVSIIEDAVSEKSEEKEAPETPVIEEKTKAPETTEKGKKEKPKSSKAEVKKTNPTPDMTESKESKIPKVIKKKNEPNYWGRGNLWDKSK